MKNSLIKTKHYILQYDAIVLKKFLTLILFFFYAKIRQKIRVVFRRALIMDSQSRQNLTKLLKLAGKKPLSVFTDLDKTSCLEGNVDFARENEKETGVKGCYMQPDIRRALTALPETNSQVYIVTGRHWSDVRINDRTGEKIPDGAFYDLLGGLEAFEKIPAVAGHGRLVVQEGKTTVLSRAASEQEAFKEQKFERYVGERVLALKEDIFKKFPEVRGEILAEYKKHLSYINLDEFMKKNQKQGAELFSFVDEQMKFIMSGKNPDGSENKDAPENPNGALFYTVEPTGSMEIRSQNQSKRNGVEKSGFLEQSFEEGGPILVLGDSLAKGGTDRDMVEAVRDFYKAKGQEDRVFVIHVMNGEENKMTDKKDACYPTISVKNPQELGQVMKMVAGHSKARSEKETAFTQVALHQKQR